MARSELSETVRGRVDPEMKDAVRLLSAEQDRSEGAIVRAALRAYEPIRSYLTKEGKR